MLRLLSCTYRSRPHDVVNKKSWRLGRLHKSTTCAGLTLDTTRRTTTLIRTYTSSAPVFQQQHTEDGYQSELESHEDAQLFFNMLDANRSGAIEADDLVRISGFLNEPMSRDAADFAVEAISDENAIDFEDFLQLWSTIPSGTNNRGPPDEPIYDDNEFEQWKRIQEVMSRFIFMYGRSANPQLASVSTHEENHFPSSQWRMYFAIPSPTDLGPDTVAANKTLPNDIIAEPLQLNDVQRKRLEELQGQETIPNISEPPSFVDGRFVESHGLGVDPHDMTDRLESALKEQYLEENDSHSDRTESSSNFCMERRLYNLINDKDSTSFISPWHDIPLMNMDGTLNLVVEIPKWSRAKLECATKEPLNPIKHDIKKKKLRNYEWGDLSWNYGFFPQTWENPEIKDIFTGYMGDGDPVDVVEIGQRCWPVGSVVRTKVLGAFALVDEGETDWKIIAISVVDPMAHQINDVDDIEVHMPGCLSAIRRWFRLYKLPNINEFALNGKAQARDDALGVIKETHKQWHDALPKV